jgi:alanine dehydrogenase
VSTLILGEEDCEALLDHPSLISSLTRAHIELDRGGATQPVPVAMRAPGDTAIDGPAFIPMPAYAPYLGLVAVKLLADIPGNRVHGQAAQRSTVALYCAQTAECLALVDGRVLTRMRTAAATALATTTLARRDSRVLGLVGAGALAVEHVHSHRAVLELDHVVVWSRSVQSCRRLAAAVDVPVRIAATVSEVFAAADVVCTLTPAEEAIVTAGMLRPGLHLNAVGSPPRPSYRELAPDVFARTGRVIVDTIDIALTESGNVRGGQEHLRHLGRELHLTELGAVLSGSGHGRGNAAEITVFNSVGIGLQDLAALELLHRRALAVGAGSLLEVRA